MVRKTRSEYGREFQPNLDLYGPLHVQSMHYRVNRRSKECNHNRESFLWDDTDSENSVKSNDCGDNAQLVPRPMSAPIYKQKHDKYNKTYSIKKEMQEKEKDKLIEQLEQGLHISQSKHKMSKVPPTPPPSLEEKLATEVENREVQTPDWSKMKPQDGTYNVASKGNSVKKRIDRPCRRPRTSSAPPAKTKTRPESPRPFISYGYGDQELETSLKRTWNVHSPLNVYPSALRAQKRRQYELELREKAAKTAPYNDRRMCALFNDFNKQMKKETSAWETEYTSHYKGYERSDYAKLVDARKPKSNHVFSVTM